jgi:hypothetical protein
VRHSTEPMPTPACPLCGARMPNACCRCLR